MKKIVSLVLALLIMLSLCPLGMAQELEPAEFTCFIDLPSDNALEGNKVLAWFEEKTNTKFDFVVKTGDEMLSMMLNTGEGCARANWFKAAIDGDK